MCRKKWFLSTVASLCFGALYADSATAHFPWLAMDAEGKALYFFGETIAQRDYKLPEKIATAEVSLLSNVGTARPIEMTIVESETFIGKQSTQAIGAAASLQSTVTFGIYGGSKLDYYTQHIAGQLPRTFVEPSTATHGLRLSAQAIDTDTGVTVRVTWNAKPLADVEVRLFCAEGHEEAMKKTNDQGEVQFNDKQVEEGLNGILVGQTLEEPGKLGEREYKSESHYLTMTFIDPQDFEAKKASKIPTGVRSMVDDSSKAVAKSTSDALPTTAETKPYGDLPMALTSFGAVRHGDKIFVYGGHTGEAHHYSTQEQSDVLLSLELSQPGAEWKEESKSRRLQGLGLVAHGQRLIRVGGFEAVNKIDEEHDLRSTDEVMSYDLASKNWMPLPSLPEPRSSHDAAVVHNRLYVVGGWTLRGEETTWLDTGWSLDLSQSDSRWEMLPKPTFTRRALALAAFGNRIYAIGGMSDQGGPTNEVDYFDIDLQTWNDAPPLVGRPMNGFGAAVWQIGDSLIATTIDGDIQKLRSDASHWETLGKTRDARFFHRLLPLDTGLLIAIGGANMEQGKFPNVEIVSIP